MMVNLLHLARAPPPMKIPQFQPMASEARVWPIAAAAAPASRVPGRALANQRPVGSGVQRRTVTDSPLLAAKRAVSAISVLVGGLQVIFQACFHQEFCQGL